jgi:tRNA 2-selenouridine synthase SelU
MKPSELTDSEKLRILELKAGGKSYDAIVLEVPHRKSKVIEVVKCFRSLPWEKAKSYCDNGQRVLALRKDYVERKTAEDKQREKTLKENIMHLRHELGLPHIWSPPGGGLEF